MKNTNKTFIFLLTFLICCASCSLPDQPQDRATGSSNTANTANSSAVNQSSSTSKRPAPTNLTGVPDPSDPAHKINLSWTRNATDNIDVEVFADDKWIANVGATPGWKGPTDTTYQLKGLTPGKTYKIKIWNFFAKATPRDDVSDFSNEITVTTAPK